MEKFKEHLNTIAGQLTPESTLEDVYEQLVLLADIQYRLSKDNLNTLGSSILSRDRPALITHYEP